MDNRRDFLKKATLLSGSLAGVSLTPALASRITELRSLPQNGQFISIEGKKDLGFEPLDPILITGIPESELLVLDGGGQTYIQVSASESYRFRAGGRLGNHLVLLKDKEGKILDMASFGVQTRTYIHDEKAYYHKLLNTLYFSMLREFGASDTVRINNRFYTFFVRWLRDHVHTLKGMKYFHGDLKSGIELYSDFQRDDGMIWDNIYNRSETPNYWEQRFGYGGFIRIIEDFKYELKRIPVENDVEYLFIEGIYYTWKATGDDTWMASLLDKAIKAVEYSFSDEYRWSEKYQLLKRGYTIDTWDFQSSYDVALTGDPMVVKPGITRFGIMFGDNTGMVAALKYLSEMLSVAGRGEEAAHYSALSEELKKTLDALSWNGNHYTHHISEDPSFTRDFGVDTDKQVSLSNAYSLNRTLSHEQCRAIIKTYQRISREMPDSSPGEFYTIYPPFKKGYGDHNSMWEYMNGGVTSIVAGELAHGAFEHGFEKYGVEILDKVEKMAASTGNYLHCTYKGKINPEPERSFTPLSLLKVANTDTSGEGKEGVPGWTLEGDNDLHEFPRGETELGGVPFSLIDPAKNGRKACLGISFHEAYTQKESLPVGAKARSVYILQTRGGTGMPAGQLNINYSDGNRHVVFMDGSRIGNWWFPEVNSSPKGGIHTIVPWRGKNNHSINVGVYLTGINNPHPQKTIENIEFQALDNGAKWMVMGVTLSDTEVYFPQGVVSFGIPDNWGAAANVYALLEGLAGVKDLSVTYRKAQIAPRWAAAGTDKVKVSVCYEASGGYSSYEYEHRKEQKEVFLRYTHSGDDSVVKILMPENHVPSLVMLDGKEVDFETFRIEDSRYAQIEVQKTGVSEVLIKY